MTHTKALTSLAEQDCTLGSETRPLVSVCLITYNHQAYFVESIESILMQRCDFPVELLLHDDCSTDGTSDLVRQYADKYPNLIKATIQPKNIYSQKIKPLPILFRQAKGKYIAILEGDDCWGDEMKLQKQKEFLEENAGFVFSFGNATLIDAQGQVLEEKKLCENACRHYSSDEIIGWRGIFPTSTVMLRNLEILQNMPSQINHVLNGDSFLFSLIGQFGDAAYQDFLPSKYRQHEEGIYSRLSQAKRVKERFKTMQKLLQVLQKDKRHILLKTMNGAYKSQINRARNEKKSAEFCLLLRDYVLFVLTKLPCKEYLASLRFCLAETKKILMS